MVQTYVVPALEKQLGLSAAALDAMRGEKTKNVMQNRTATLEKALADILVQNDALGKALSGLADETTESKIMKKIASDLIPLAQKVRVAADLAERLVADDLWPLPKYREMLFSNVIS
jgi:glutamine synthetase type III